MSREEIMELINKENVKLVEGAYIACYLLGKDVEVLGARGDAQTEYNYLYAKVKSNEIRSEKQGKTLYVKTEDVKRVFSQDNIKLDINSDIQNNVDVVTNVDEDRNMAAENRNFEEKYLELKNNYNNIKHEYEKLKDENSRLNKQIQILNFKLEGETTKYKELYEKLESMILNS